VTRVCRLGGDRRFFHSLCRRKGGGVHLSTEEVGRLSSLGKKKNRSDQEGGDRRFWCGS